MAPAGRRHLGGAWSAPALHALQGDGVARVRPRGEGSRGVRPRGARRAVANDPRRDPPPDLQRRVRRRARGVHPVVRVEEARCRRAHDADDRVPSRHRRTGGRNRQRDRTAADEGRLRRPVRDEPDWRSRRIARRGKARSSPARSGWRTTSRSSAATTTRVALFERLLGLANDVGLLAEEYDGAVRDASSATSRRRSPTCRLVNTAAHLSKVEPLGRASPPCRSEPEGATMARHADRDRDRLRRPRAARHVLVRGSRMGGRRPRRRRISRDRRRLAADRRCCSSRFRKRRSSRTASISTCAPTEDQRAEVGRIIGLGARLVDIGQGDVSWVVLADPEGNEFCVLRGTASARAAPTRASAHSLRQGERSGRSPNSLGGRTPVRSPGLRLHRTRR